MPQFRSRFIQSRINQFVVVAESIAFIAPKHSAIDFSQQIELNAGIEETNLSANPLFSLHSNKGYTVIIILRPNFIQQIHKLMNRNEFLQSEFN